MWVAFARMGNPNHSGMRQWPAYTPKDRATMIFADHCKLMNDPQKDRCRGIGVSTGMHEHPHDRRKGPVQRTHGDQAPAVHGTAAEHRPQHNDRDTRAEACRK